MKCPRRDKESGERLGNEREMSEQDKEMENEINVRDERLRGGGRRDDERAPIRAYIYTRVKHTAQSRAHVRITEEGRIGRSDQYSIFEISAPPFKPGTGDPPISLGHTISLLSFPHPPPHIPCRTLPP